MAAGHVSKTFCSHNDIGDRWYPVSRPMGGVGKESASGKYSLTYLTYVFPKVQ